MAAAGTPLPPEQGEPKQGFVGKLTKSIRDFGFGKRSLVEGGVGLFVFSGIGAAIAPPERHGFMLGISAAAVPCAAELLHTYRDCQGLTLSLCGSIT